MSVTRQADFSPCRRYRYSLRRRWNAGRTWLMVMLNPSVADAEKDDPTTRFCMNRAMARGYGSYEAVNLFALIGTDPRCLVQGVGIGRRVGPDYEPKRNDAAIREALDRADTVVVAWGAAKFPIRILQVERLIGGRAVYCFGLTKHGCPRFPRALRCNVELVPYHRRLETR